MAVGIFGRFGDYVMSNRTTIESLEAGAPRTCVAVRIEEWELRRVSTTSGYIFTTFPLSSPPKAATPVISEKPASQPNHNDNEISSSDSPKEIPPKDSEDNEDTVEPLKEASPQQQAENQTPRQPVSSLSSRYALYIILLPKPGSNIWDLGILNNVKSMMGERIIDWFIPWKLSPCLDDHDPGDEISEYPLGKDFYIMERVALPHRYDESGKRKRPLYPEEERSSRSSGGHRRRKQRSSQRLSV
jgi:hypothetical protein